MTRHTLSRFALGMTLAAVATLPVLADSSDARVGDHPAVVIKRSGHHPEAEAAQKFYMHPAASAMMYTPAAEAPAATAPTDTSARPALEPRAAVR